MSRIKKNKRISKIRKLSRDLSILSHGVFDKPNLKEESRSTLDGELGKALVVFATKSYLLHNNIVMLLKMHQIQSAGILLRNLFENWVYAKWIRKDKRINKNKSMELETLHYKAKCRADLKDVAHRYISDVEKVWEIMIDIFGREPPINKYRVEFNGNKVYYLGGGLIKMYESELETLPPYPEDLTRGLVFETFHGFLEHIKHRPYGQQGQPYYGENKLGESFSTILKIELLERSKLSKDANEYRRGKGMGPGHHQLLFLLVEIHKKYGISLFQKLFRLLEENEKPIITEEMPKDKLCYHLSLCAKGDLSEMFEKHNYKIDLETKKKIKQLLLN